MCIRDSRIHGVDEGFSIRLQQVALRFLDSHHTSVVPVAFHLNRNIIISSEYVTNARLHRIVYHNQCEYRLDWKSVVDQELSHSPLHAIRLLGSVLPIGLVLESPVNKTVEIIKIVRVLSKPKRCVPIGDRELATEASN